MLSCKLLTHILTVITTIGIFSELPARAMPVKPVIFFDLNGVLFDVNKKLAQKHAQFTPEIALAYLFKDGKNPLKFKKRFLELLAHVPCDDILLHKSPGRIMAQGDPMPKIMIAHHEGKISGAAALERIRITFNILREKNSIVSERELQLLLRTAQIAFDPQLRFSLSKIDPQMIMLIKKLKKQGYQVCALSNQDREFLGTFKKHAPELYKLFNHIILSADIGVCKPHKNIFDHACHVAGTTTHLSILIDDQAENIAGAVTVGMRGIHHTSAQKTTAQLRLLGVRT